MTKELQTEPADRVDAILDELEKDPSMPADEILNTVSREEAEKQGKAILSVVEKLIELNVVSEVWFPEENGENFVKAMVPVHFWVVTQGRQQTPVHVVLNERLKRKLIKKNPNLNVLVIAADFLDGDGVERQFRAGLAHARQFVRPTR